MRAAEASGSRERPAHALTFDFEDWHQLGYRRMVGRFGPLSPGLPDATHRILDMMDQFGIRGTFFVLGYLAEICPDLVREIARRGHEIGSHSHSHEKVTSMSRAGFRSDLERAKSFLEDMVGASVRGFRAPRFSIDALDHWAFDVLAELGFTYDSSLFPASFASYGLPAAPRRPFVLATRSGPLWEFPLATWRVAKWNLPVAGGGYFRLLPVWLLRRALRAIENEDGTTVLYFHPYEFYNGRLSLAGLPRSRFLSPAYWKLYGWYNFNTRAIGERVAQVIPGRRFLPLGELQGSLVRSSLPEAV
jgi:polysaccharide deacetylase family protein (PEP-CTERM system associated)